MNRFSHRYKMVSAKDDSLPTNIDGFEADADEAVTSRFNGEDADVGSTRSKKLAVFDRKTCDLSRLIHSNPKIY